MNHSGSFMDKWKNFLKNDKQPVETAAAEPQEKGKVSFSEGLRIIGMVIFRLRKIFMAIPVVYFALRLAAYNSDNLPLLVGLDLQTTGEFAHTISRQGAVSFPLIVTGACLVLMFFSRKSVYPWLISIFSLVIPVLLLITNIYPA